MSGRGFASELLYAASKQDATTFYTLLKDAADARRPSQHADPMANTNSSADGVSRYRPGMFRAAHRSPTPDERDQAPQPAQQPPQERQPPPPTLPTCKAHPVAIQQIREAMRSAPTPIQWQILRYLLNLIVHKEDTTDHLVDSLESQLGVDLNYLFAPIPSTVEKQVLSYMTSFRFSLTGSSSQRGHQRFAVIFIQFLAMISIPPEQFRVQRLMHSDWHHLTGETTNVASDDVAISGEATADTICEEVMAVVDSFEMHQGDEPLRASSGNFGSSSSVCTCFPSAAAPTASSGGHSKSGVRIRPNQDYLASTFRSLVRTAFGIESIEHFVNSNANPEWVLHHAEFPELYGAIAVSWMGASSHAVLHDEDDEAAADNHHQPTFEETEASMPLVPQGEDANAPRTENTPPAAVEMMTSLLKSSTAIQTPELRANASFLLGQLAATGYAPVFYLLWHMVDHPNPTTINLMVHLLFHALTEVCRHIGCTEGEEQQNPVLNMMSANALFASSESDNDEEMPSSGCKSGDKKGAAAQRAKIKAILQRTAGETNLIPLHATLLELTKLRDVFLSRHYSHLAPILLPKDKRDVVGTGAAIVAVGMDAEKDDEGEDEDELAINEVFGRGSDDAKRWVKGVRRRIWNYCLTGEIPRPKMDEQEEQESVAKSKGQDLEDSKSKGPLSTPVYTVSVICTNIKVKQQNKEAAAPVYLPKEVVALIRDFLPVHLSNPLSFKLSTFATHTYEALYRGARMTSRLLEQGLKPSFESSPGPSQRAPFDMETKGTLIGDGLAVNQPPIGTGSFLDDLPREDVYRAIVMYTAFSDEEIVEMAAVHKCGQREWAAKTFREARIILAEMSETKRLRLAKGQDMLTAAARKDMWPPPVVQSPSEAQHSSPFRIW